MPASTRLRPLLLALALTVPAASALAHPLYATAAPGAAASRAPAIDIDIGDVAGGGVDVIGAAIGAPGSGLDLQDLRDVQDPQGARAIGDSVRRPATACRFDGGCYAVRPDPLSPVPEPGVIAMLCFGLALVVLRGQRQANLPFRVE